MNGSQLRRMWAVVIGLGFASVIIVGRLVAFQVVQGAQVLGGGRAAEPLVDGAELVFSSEDDLVEVADSFGYALEVVAVVFWG